ncbi:MAG TPA: glycine zipper 2TM domain-containing protein [Caldimonas sp.]|nr:glycine zipper 2TM domain-containing protein [Caldimonas sp.]
MKTKLKTGAIAAASAVLLGASATAGAAEYANVVSATPVAESVAVPRQDCVQSEQLVRAQPSGAGAVIGAIAGGVIGHQFGHGFGTGVGAVAGAAVGNGVEANANPPQSVPVQRCRSVNAYESRVVGYDVVYEYRGQRYTTRLPNDPGPRLAVDVRPTAAAPLDRVGPPASYGTVPPAYAQAAPSYSEAPSTYYDAPPAYYAPAPVYYSAPYGVPYYVAPAAIGLGIGYWIGSTWHRGYRHGGYGHRGWH